MEQFGPRQPGLEVPISRMRVRIITIWEQTPSPPAVLNKAFIPVVRPLATATIQPCAKLKPTRKGCDPQTDLCVIRKRCTFPDYAAGGVIRGNRDTNQSRLPGDNPQEPVLYRTIRLAGCRIQGFASATDFARFVSTRPAGIRSS